MKQAAFPVPGSIYSSFLSLSEGCEGKEMTNDPSTIRQTAITNPDGSIVVTTVIRSRTTWGWQPTPLLLILLALVIVLAVVFIFRKAN
jgi:hypothetical protein